MWCTCLSTAAGKQEHPTFPEGPLEPCRRGAVPVSASLTFAETKSSVCVRLSQYDSPRWLPTPLLPISWSAKAALLEQAARNQQN